jgi:maltokinase
MLSRHGLADLLDERLLSPLRLQQEVREFLYAVRHLPVWRYVPDGALVDLLPDPAGPTAATSAQE